GAVTLWRRCGMCGMCGIGLVTCTFTFHTHRSGCGIARCALTCTFHSFHSFHTGPEGDVSTATASTDPAAFNASAATFAGVFRSHAQRRAYGGWPDTVRVFTHEPHRVGGRVAEAGRDPLPLGGLGCCFQVAAV